MFTLRSSKIFRHFICKHSDNNKAFAKQTSDGKNADVMKYTNNTKTTRCFERQKDGAGSGGRCSRTWYTNRKRTKTRLYRAQVTYMTRIQYTLPSRANKKKYVKAIALR